MNRLIPLLLVAAGCKPALSITAHVTIQNQSGYDFDAAQACVITNALDERCSPVVEVQDGQEVDIDVDFVAIKNDTFDYYAYAVDFEGDGYETPSIESYAVGRELFLDLPVTFDDCCHEPVL